MSTVEDFLQKIAKIVKKHKEYKTEAYHFVMAGLNFTLTRMGEHRHLTGQELSLGIKDYVLQQFGPLARTVLEYWGIKTTFDFGKIVYYLIDAKLMTKTEEDSLDDFKDVYAFDEAFKKNYDYLEQDGE
jgi:uncharacterized repeat protein (TIGR04138 family)